MAESSEERSYRHGLTASLPLSVAVFGFGVSYGVLALSVGMGALAPAVMSATTFAGSAQFAAASVLGAGGSATTAILAALMLDARYLPLGSQVATCLEVGLCVGKQPWHLDVSSDGV